MRELQSEKAKAAGYKTFVSDNFDKQTLSHWEQLDKDCRLFNSSTWNKVWWHTWGEANNLKPCIIIVTQNADTVAIIPLFEKQTWQSRGHYQFLGNIYPTDITILTEYSDVLVSRDHEAELKNLMLELLLSINFKTLTCAFSHSKSFFSSLTFKRRALTEHSLPDGVIINTEGQFKAYLSELGKNTRLKLFNRRTYCNQHYQLKLDYAKNPNEIGQAFALLNTFHKERWGRPCFNEQSLSFHQSIATTFCERQKLGLSVLRLDGEPVSVLYNISYNGVDYNIQAGFRENFDKKLSLGTLHIGYALEKAFDNKDIESFDLLLGAGKNNDYKKRLTSKKIQFHTQTVYSSFNHKVLYTSLNFVSRAINKLKRS